MSKAPMAGSRKAKVYDAFHDGGLVAALKAGKGLDLKEGTIKSWCGGWAGKPRAEHQVTKAARVRLEKEGTPVKADKAAAFEPWFKHATREEAEQHRRSISRRAGCDVKAYHIIEEGGRCAVVPAHYKPGGPCPQFEKGDVVFDTIIPNRRGVILNAGPEQCEVRYKGGQPDQIIPNYYLHKFEAPAKGKRVRV